MTHSKILTTRTNILDSLVARSPDIYSKVINSTPKIRLPRMNGAISFIRTIGISARRAVVITILSRSPSSLPFDLISLRIITNTSIAAIAATTDIDIMFRIMLRPSMIPTPARMKRNAMIRTVFLKNFAMRWLSFGFFTSSSSIRFGRLVATFRVVALFPLRRIIRFPKYSGVTS